MIKTSIGNKIKSIRELKNYTQQYVAEQLEMTQAGYSKIERGTASLSIEKLEQLSVILELPIESIINFEKSSYFVEARNYVVCDSSNGVSFNTLKKLYEDKIELLEKLLLKTDKEVQYYKEKCGLV
ncbi:helix-turn-helix domain-containing protein [Flavobacterium foetidum]|uniref:helix-turn-helix domain-containing protein n=1 Tax=Flavobacterium foetidum TaxID=2026681 RepID=UPI001FC9E0E4|nr:helix-turn-helix transcriptional regulator [Flavobacterium foetidum]